MLSLIFSPHAAPDISTVAGTPGVISAEEGSGSNTYFGSVAGLAVDQRGSIYVVDSSTYKLRVSVANSSCTCDHFFFAHGVNAELIAECRRAVFTTLAGNGSNLFADGMGTDACFNTPLGVAVDPTTTADVGIRLYVTSNTSPRVRVVTISNPAASSCLSGTIPASGTANVTCITCSPGFFCPGCTLFFTFHVL